jgi:hypothetical protein
MLKGPETFRVNTAELSFRAVIVPHCCHSERSEESTWILPLTSNWILRFAQQ